MSLRHKRVERFNDMIRIGTSTMNATHLIRLQIDHIGKDNHTVIGNFSVQQTQNNTALDIRFYILSEEQFISWVVENLGKSVSFPHPKYVVFGNGNLAKMDNFQISITASYNMYLILDNRHSFSTLKNVKVSVIEEWDESTSSLDVVTTIPPHDTSLKQDVERLISSAREDLKIITPYIDMSLISEILQKHSNGVNIEIITRTKKEFTGKGAKEGFDHINKNLDKNHKTNEHIHSRIIIRDSQEALVSSADLTQDSLLGQFNAGVIVSEPSTITKLSDYFKNVWNKSSFT